MIKIKKVAVPGIGHYQHSVKVLGEELGFEIITTPTNRRTMEIGASCSPEGICIPFRMMMGQYVQAIAERDVDACLFIGGYGT